MADAGTTAGALSHVPEESAPFGVQRVATPLWESALVVGSLVAAAFAVWLTLRAGFFSHPGWLAAQKADSILGPIGVGLYWHYRRPHNRFGLLLIALGLVGVVYVLGSLRDPTLFHIGVEAEAPMYIGLNVVILAFPSGRLDGLPERLVIAVNVATSVFVDYLFWPPSGPGFPISECRVECPGNGGATSYMDSWLIRNHVIAAFPVVVALATAAVIAWRFATGTPPRRRALAIGAPIALLFLLAEAVYRGIFLVHPKGLASGWTWIQEGLQWSLAGTRSLVWYGFLFALIAAELYAGRVLRTLVRRALNRPSLPDLEAMLRGPLGDPGLRLGFRAQATTGGWVDADGEVLGPKTGQTLTEFQRDPTLAVAIVHDVQLSEDPELLETAAEIALLALEHDQLAAGQREAFRELADSRARLVTASDRERRRLERDLHDGAQASLTAVQIKLDVAREAITDQQLTDELAAISEHAATAAHELRTLSHGIYPTVLRSRGLVAAVKALGIRSTIPVVITDYGIGRCSAGVEAAIYFCCAEAIQNATKHAGPGATVSVTFGRDRHEIRFTVADDGVGMREPADGTGDGLVGMTDRIGAVGGHIEITSTPGHGVAVRGSIPTDSLATHTV